MKCLSLFFILFLSFIGTVKSQCTGCMVNSSCTVSPAFPTTCPTAMPDATTGQYYEEDMTFWLPPNFDDPDTGFNVDFEQMTITGVQGLPFGMNYEPNNVNGVYFPQQNEFGCARICGTALSPGLFNVTISVMVDVEFSGIPVSLPQQFVMPLTVLPGISGNNSFSFTPTSGCDTVCAEFTALIDGSPLPTEYSWFLPDGSVLNGPNMNYCFSDSGSNFISLQTDILQYVITDVFLDGVNDDWCGDVEEPDIFGCTLAPDLYFVVTNGNGNTVFTSSSGTDSESEEWTNLNIVLNDPPYSIQFWDEDLISGDDVLGTFNLPLSGTGNYPFNVAGGTNGSVNVETQLFQTFLDQDSVSLFITPNIDLVYDSLNNALALPLDDALFVWFLDGDTIPFNSDSLISLGDPGNYWVTATSAFGCSFVSDTFLLCPSVILNVDLGLGLLSVASGFISYQWFFNGIEINGATDQFLIMTGAGTYWVEVSNGLGCTVVSNSFIDATGIEEYSNAKPIQLYPNPSTGLIEFFIPNTPLGLAKIEVFDLLGSLVAAREIYMNDGHAKMDLRVLANGSYLMQVEVEKELFYGRFIKHSQ